jgi:hypothetical protein
MLENQVEVEEYMMLLGNFFSKVKQYNIKVGYIDCLAKSNTKTCSNIHQGMVAQKYSLVLFTDTPQLNPYTKKQYRKAELFNGKPSETRQIEKFLVKQFSPSNYKSIERSIIENVDKELSSVTKPTLAVVVSTEKSSSFKNMIFKSIAHQFGDLIDVVIYKAKEMIASELIKASATATTLHLIQPSKEVSSYEGDATKISAISSWISSIVGSEPSSSSDKSKAKDSSSTTDEDKEDTISPSTSLIFTSTNLTESDIPLTEEWIIAVARSNSSDLIAKSEWRKIESSAGGVVKTAILHCDQNKIPGISTSLCEYEYEGDYIVIVPYGSSARKKFVSKAAKWSLLSLADVSIGSGFFTNNIGSTLPESEIESISEQLFQDVIQRAIVHHRLPVFFIPMKDAESLPAAVVHTALAMDKYVQTVVLSNPSKGFMKQFGGAVGPALMVMMPMSKSASGEDQQISLQAVVFDPNIHGSFSYRRIKRFLKEIYLK